MVRAILDGSKTQTRRVVKPQPSDVEYLHVGGGVEWPCRETPEGRTAMYCPYGQPGDKLWVRETFLVDDNRRITGTRKNYEVDYKATSEDSPHWRWRPSIHMPRWASRITLEITDTRVERLNNISNNDALDEGTPDLRTIENNWDMVRCYRELWDKINGPGSWASNPWVWVIVFKT